MTIFLTNSKSEKIKNGVSNLNKIGIEFDYKGNHYSTEKKNYHLLGETYDYVFVYELKNSKTLIVKKELTENYKVISKPNKIDVFLEKINEKIKSW